MLNICNMDPRRRENGLGGFDFDHHSGFEKKPYEGWVSLDEKGCSGNQWHSFDSGQCLINHTIYK